MNSRALLFCLVSLFAGVLSAAGTVYVSDVAGSDLTAIDAATDTVLPSSPVMVGSSPRQFVVSSDQTRLYVPDFNSNTVSVVDTSTNMVVQTINLMGGTGPTAVALTPDQSRLYVACLFTDDVRVVDTTTFMVTDIISGFSFPNALGITPNGNEVYVSNPGMGTGPNVKVIDNTLVNPMISFTISSPGLTGPNLLDITPDGQQVYVTNPGSTVVSAISTASHTVTQDITVGNGPFWVEITHDGSRVYVPCANAMRVDVIDTASNTVVSTVTVGDTPVWADVTPDDTKVYVAVQNDNSVGVIANSVAPPTMLAGPLIMVGTTPQSLGVTPDGTKVFVANTGSNTVSSIDTATDTVDTLSIPTGSNPNYIGFAGFITPSTSVVTGSRRQNRFFTQTDFINTITWTVPTSGGPFVTYLIYRDASLTDLADQVPASAPLIFEDHNRKKNQTYSYYVVGVDQSAATTLLGSVTVYGS